MTKQARICVIGSANADLTFRTARLPMPGETLAGREFHLGLGGKGANQAVMAARLGAHVSFLARVGKDAFGLDSLKRYSELGLDTSCIQIDPDHSTGVAAIVVDDDARNCILVVPGANGALSPSDVESAKSAICAADFLLGQLEVPLDTIVAAFRTARAANVRTILNPAPALPLPDELLRLTDVCVPNETELAALTGLATTSLEDVAAAARILRQRGAGTVLVTLGDRGVLLLHDDEALAIPAVPVAAVDPTGAGDAFIGSLAVFWAETGDLRAAASLANAVAALTVQRPGAQLAFPTRAEVESFRIGKSLIDSCMDRRKN
jgi:ribokinase